MSLVNRDDYWYDGGVLIIRTFAFFMLLALIVMSKLQNKSHSSPPNTSQSQIIYE